MLRSHFWLGAAIRPYAPAALAAPVGALLNRAAIRRLAVPKEAPRALACAEEYANLATLLPSCAKPGSPPPPCPPEQRRPPPRSRGLESRPMASSQGIGSSGTRLLSPIIALLGAAIIVRTLAAGGGVLSAGVLYRAVFVAIGLGRLYLSLRASR